MKTKVIILLFLSICLFSCNSKETQKITVSNNSSLDLDNYMVEFPISRLKGIDITKQYIAITSQGDTLLTQLTHDNNCIILIDLKARQKTALLLVENNEKTYISKVDAKVHTDRKNDFAWENDKVGFRFYAKELEAIDGPSNGLDIWLKRTDKLVLDKWYHNDVNGIESYHTDHGEGCDPYPVGRTLGAGSNAPLINGKLVLNTNYLSSEILDNGPLRSTFKLIYPDIIIGNDTLKESKIISLDAGSHLNKVQQFYSNSAHLSLAVGIAKRLNNDTIITSSDKSTFIYKDPINKENKEVFIGSYIPQKFDSIKIDTYKYTNPLNNYTSEHSHFLAITTIQPQQTFEYYVGFGWSKYGFKTIEDFEKYMKDFKTKLENPVKIEFN